MNFIIFILAIIKLSQSQIPEKQKICDPSIRFCYGDENDNFIRNFLKNLSEEEKKKEMDI
jgi:hypothetical protein